MVLREISEGMQQLNIDQVAFLASRLGDSERKLTSEEFIDLNIAIAEWLADQGADARAIQIYADLLASLRANKKPDISMIAQVADRLAELQLSSDQASAAAETLGVAIQLTGSLEGEESNAILWRMEKRAEALTRAGDRIAARALFEDIQSRRQSQSQRTRGLKRSKVGEAKFQLVTIHFATHRARTGRSNPYDFFRGKRQIPMTYGRAVVSVPKNREGGSLPTPPSWVGDNRADPDLYLVLKSIDVLDRREEFFSELNGAIASSSYKEVLLFIHGYNTSFAKALLRTAQLSVDLEIDGAALLYSWPSRGNVLSYLMDKNEAAAPLALDVKDLIRDVASQTQAQKIHLVAHSMGAEFLLKAMEELQVERHASQTAQSHSQPLFSEVVFAAPDVDADDFRVRVPRISTLATRLTVYSSRNDVALAWSEWAHGEIRAGQTTFRGIECVDTSKSGGDLFRHDDYVTAATDDLRAIIWLSLRPNHRRALRALEGPNGTFWLHDPDALDGETLATIRQALIWARRLGVEEAIKTVARLLNTPGSSPPAGIPPSLLVELSHMSTAETS